MHENDEREDGRKSLTSPRALEERCVRCKSKQGERRGIEIVREMEDAQTYQRQVERLKRGKKSR